MTSAHNDRHQEYAAAADTHNILSRPASHLTVAGGLGASRYIFEELFLLIELNIIMLCPHAAQTLTCNHHIIARTQRFERSPTGTIFVMAIFDLPSALLGPFDLLCKCNPIVIPTTCLSGPVCVCVGLCLSCGCGCLASNEQLNCRQTRS